MNAGLIILAGGKSSRMGTNKAMLPIDGKTNIEKIIETLSPAFPHIVLVTNDPKTYEWLGIPITTDEYPGQGPLAGIHAGLKKSACELNLVVACDMPFVSAPLAEYLVGLGEQIDAVVPSWDGQVHPLFAVYRKSCFPIIEDCIKQGNLRMTHFLDLLNIHYVNELELKNIILSDEAFTNMNTPEEYQIVTEKISKKRKKNL